MEPVVIKKSLLGVLMLLALLVTACGDKKQPLEVIDWPYLEKATSLKINGTELKGFVLKTEMHRRRGANGLGIKAGEALAYLYPKLAEAPKLKFDNAPEATKLVFIDEGGKVIKVEDVKPFSSVTFPQTYRVEGTRVVLQVLPSDFDKLKLSAGAAFSSDPNLVKDSDSAEGEFATVYFFKEKKAEDKPADAPNVRLKVLDEPEDVARGLKDRPELKDGEGVLIPVGQGSPEFWLKEVGGTCCACWLVRGQGQFQRGLVVGTIFENIKDEGSRDLDRPIYFGAEKPLYLALFKGADFFKNNKIEERSGVSIGAMEYGNNDKLDYDSIDVKFGSKILNTRLVRGSEAIRHNALLDAPALREGKGLVFDFSDASFVEFNPAGLAGEVELLFISGDGGSYKIADRKKLDGKSAPIKPGDIKTGRFVVVASRGFDVSGTLNFPYSLRDLKPELPTLAFYGMKDDVVTERLPAKPLGLAHVELAITDAEQHKGLMYRTALRLDHGMIFIYKEEQDEMSYWMKNCKMDIAIAFVDRKGVIVKIHNRMKAPDPSTPDSQLPEYKSGGPCQYAIEMEADWYSKHNIKEGDRVFIPPHLIESE